MKECFFLNLNIGFEKSSLFKVQYPRAPDNKPMELTFVSGEKVPEFTDEGEIDLSVVIPAYNEKGKTEFHLYQK